MYLQRGSVLATNTIVPLHAGNAGRFVHFAQFERQLPSHQGMFVTFADVAAITTWYVQYGHPYVIGIFLLDM